MRRIFSPVSALLLSALLPAAAPAEPRTALGLDVALPYLLQVDGVTVKSRGNLNLGFDGRYFLDEHVNVGGRFAFDVEKRAGSERQISFAPGAQYRWMTEERFSPFVRFDVPWILSNEMDLGISGGGGVVWNLGGALGLPGGALRYDFNLQYLFGLGGALPVLAMEFFKFGVECRF